MLFGRGVLWAASWLIAGIALAQEALKVPAIVQPPVIVGQSCDPARGIPCPPSEIPRIVTPAPSVVVTSPAVVAPAAEAVRPPVPARAEERAASAVPMERNEFQDFVARSLGRDLPMFGYNLFVEVPTTFAPVDRIPVTPDYVVGPGDEILIRAWGQVDIDYRAVVDRTGTINIPRVGSLHVAGIRYQELESFIRNAIGRVFRNFELNVTLGQLRSIQIFVVGQARRPGSYTVSSLSTLVNALFASGGPSLKGSMRRIQLRRADRLITEFDLYDLLLKGDKSKDTPLLPGDVIYVPPIGPLVAITGSVNVPAIYELRDAASLRELIEWAGGLATTAAGQRVTVERLAERRVRVVEEFTLDKPGLGRPLKDGDLVTVYAVSPKIANAVTLRGYVAQPARFPWREGLRIKDLIPDREALLAPDYWLRRNALLRPDDWIRRPLEVAATRQTDPAKLHAEVKRSTEINWDYAVVERIKPDDLTTQLLPFNLGKAVLEGAPEHNLLLAPGDVITIFSKDDIQVPVAKQTQYVRLEGEVQNPGVYQLMPGETLRQLVARVGGFTANAYLYGAEFTRESTRALQQRRLDEAIERLSQEVERLAAGAAQTALSKEEAEAAKVRAENQRRLIARLREIRATGRIVLNVAPERTQLKDLPDVVLEDGDRFFVPSRPSTVGVLGAVYNANAFLYDPAKRVSDYLELAGGPTRDADTARIYVVRADGSVFGRAQASLFLGFGGERLMPGDTIVVPELLDKYGFTRALKDWSQIFYQFALGVAGLKVLRHL